MEPSSMTDNALLKHVAMHCKTCCTALAAYPAREGARKGETKVHLVRWAPFLACRPSCGTAPPPLASPSLACADRRLLQQKTR
eukprot:scaffold9279_cov159-Amphora_coffeaeformis.AAC.4